MNEQQPKTITLTETDKEEFKEIVKQSLIGDKSNLDDISKIKDVETVKIIISELLGVKEHLPSTTNLTKKQIHGISKLKAMNLLYKSPMIDQYIYSIMELKRSETKEPFNMLKGFFDLANNIKSGFDDVSRIGNILGKKGKM